MKENNIVENDDDKDKDNSSKTLQTTNLSVKFPNETHDSRGLSLSNRTLDAISPITPISTEIMDSKTEKVCSKTFTYKNLF